MTAPRRDRERRRVVRANAADTARADQVRYARELLLDVKEERALADTKASLLLAAVGVVGSVGATAVIDRVWTPAELSTVAAVLWWVGTAGLLAAVVMLAGAVYPRTSAGPHRLPDAITYFGDVGRYRDVAQVRAALSRSASSELEILSARMIRLSQLTVRKYFLIRLALWTLAGVLCAYLSSAGVEILGG